MEFMLLLHSKNAYWLCTRCTIVVVAIEAVVVQWRVTHGVKAGAVLVWSASCYIFGKGQFQELSSSRRDPSYLMYRQHTGLLHNKNSLRRQHCNWRSNPHRTRQSWPIQLFVGSCEVLFLVSRFCCHLQPSTQTRSSQIAVSPGPKVALSPSQSESKKQPHMWSLPLESIGPAPQRGRSNGQFASLAQPFKAIYRSRLLVGLFTWPAGGPFAPEAVVVVRYVADLKKATLSSKQVNLEVTWLCPGHSWLAVHPQVFGAPPPPQTG